MGRVWRDREILLRYLTFPTVLCDETDFQGQYRQWDSLNLPTGLLELTQAVRSLYVYPGRYFRNPFLASDWHVTLPRPNVCLSLVMWALYWQQATTWMVGTTSWHPRLGLSQATWYRALDNSLTLKQRVVETEFEKLSLLSPSPGFQLL